MFDCQTIHDVIHMLEGQSDHMQRVLAEVKNGHKRGILFPRNLEIRGEVLVQVPDVHVHAGKGSLDLLLRILVIPDVFIDVQVTDLSGEVYKQFQLVIFFIWMVDIRAFLLQLIISRDAFETGTLVDHFFRRFRLLE